MFKTQEDASRLVRNDGLSVSLVDHVKRGGGRRPGDTIAIDARSPGRASSEKELPTMSVRTLVGLAVAGVALTLQISTLSAQDNPVVVMETSMGAITIELYLEEAPISVENFLTYVDEDHYDGTIFHRVIADFMIQGGRFEPDMTPRATHAEIKNEAENGLLNDEYTVAMARTNAVDSATDQFFINGKDNAFLNNGVRDFGYAVFGKVIDGTSVVDAIEATPVDNSIPTTPVIIESLSRR
tara:strand:+ start:2686 stop:3405 length:720 start_codon:yes stop_codon:yes gene_type:complete